jgi:predicted phage terminase large subunit-like protein
LQAFAMLALAPERHRPAAHHRLIIAELEALARGENDRLMLLLPPGSAKSTYASVIFPAWWFTQAQHSNVIAACHTASLASHFGRRARNLVAEHRRRLGIDLAPDARASANWATTEGGSYYATGVRGPITGRRADLVLIDDPVKSQAEADSAAARAHVWQWYQSDLISRLKPGGKIVLIMTRWHEDDLGGRILAEEAAGGDRWRVLRLPALAESDDPLGRAEGCALWPEWENHEALARKRRIIGERAWAALYQQRPRPPEGLLFQTEAITLLDAAPRAVARVRAWDLAASIARPGFDPDWTVGLRLLKDEAGRFVVDDVVRLRGGPHEVEQAILACAARDGRETTVLLPQDPGQAGRAQVLYLTRKLAGHHVVSGPESGAKTTRAAPVASQTACGNLALVKAPFTRALIEELRDFPAGTKDDQVDALSRAFAHLSAAPQATRQINLPLLSR